MVTRFGADPPARERAQIALARLRDPHGYDLWWLARPDAIETRPWFVLFPVLTTGTALLMLLAPFWPQLLAALVVLLIVNVLVRYVTDRRIGTAAGALRQLAPVIATGESLQFLAVEDFRSLVGALQADVPRLRRVKTIARWISGDPFMLPVSPGSFGTLLSDVVQSVYEYLNLAFLLDANGVYFAAGELRARGAGLLRVLAAIGEVDAAISVASVRAGRRDWVRPRFREPGTRAVLADIRHPLLTSETQLARTASPSITCCGPARPPLETRLPCCGCMARPKRC
jgi:hypothetical protein